MSKKPDNFNLYHLWGTVLIISSIPFGYDGNIVAPGLAVAGGLFMLAAAIFESKKDENE